MIQNQRPDSVSLSYIAMTQKQIQNTKKARRFLWIICAMKNLMPYYHLNIQLNIEPGIYHEPGKA